LHIFIIEIFGINDKKVNITARNSIPSAPTPKQTDTGNVLPSPQIPCKTLQNHTDVFRQSFQHVSPFPLSNANISI